MAGFDLDTQRVGAAHGIKMECGHVTFTAGSRELEVPTTLNTVFMGLGIIKTDTTDGNHQLVCSCDNGVSTVGAATFTRHGPYFGDAAVMNYLLLGW